MRFFAHYLWLNVKANCWCLLHPTWRIMIVELFGREVHVCAENPKGHVKTFGVVKPEPARLSFLIIPLWRGQLNVKWARNSLFSERHGRVPTVRIGPLRLTWRRYASASEHATNGSVKP